MKEHSYPSYFRKSTIVAVRFLACALFALLLLPFITKAQDTGYISGTVMDKSGAAVIGADVVISNSGGNLTRNTSTNSDGAYVVAGLPGGTYNLVVTAKGFQKYTAQNVVLDVAQKIRVDVTLNVGALTDEVVVTGDSVAQVETQSSSLSNTITGKQVNQLELNGRNFTQLVTLTPGVVDQTGSDEGKVGVYGNVAYSMNGGRTEYNNWELDGGDNMDNGSNSTLNVYPNLEAIAEFKVLTSSYGAQYGRNGSGTIEVETKSGTNSFHGSAFYYGRNEAFNANDFFDNANGNARAPYRKHDFGYTIGGPVFIPNHYNSDKKKTFFFFSEEWRREKNVSTAAPGSNGSSIADVPSNAERSGNFSDICPGVDCPHQPNGTPFPNNTITPTAVGQALLATIPQANTVDKTNNNPAFTETVSEPTTWREELVRLDHNINDNYRLTFRYIHDSWQTVVPGALWGANANGSLPSFQNVSTGFVGPGTSFVARLNANITPTLLNEFVASYTADHIFLTAGGPVTLPSSFPMGTLFPQATPFGGVIPSITLTANAAYGGGFWTDTGYFPWNNANPTYTYRDNVTKVVKTHTLQFGAYLAFAQKNEQNSPELQGILTFDSTKPFSTGNAFADLLLGNIASYNQVSAKAKYYNRYKIVEPYFQDDWRVTKKLTLNLGLRVSLFGTYRERYQQAFNFDPTAFNTANEPIVNADGTLAQNAGGTANALNGVVQCGGKGGTFPLIPGSAFPSAVVGANSNAGCLKGHLFNPAPRIGFAFDPKGDGKTAIRGGYGVFFEHTNGNEANTESLEGSAPLVLNATQSNIAPGLGSCAANSEGGYGCIGGAGAAVPVPALSPTSVPDKVVWPYMQQWNLNVQRELPSHVVLSVAYVGSKGTHLTLVNNLNQLQPTDAADNPFAAGQTLAGTNACVGPNGSANVGPWSAGQTVPGTSKALTSQSALNLNVACGLVTANSVRTAFPGYGSLNGLRDVANSAYNALQVSANRTLGALTLSLSYAYSHSIDDSSDRSDNALLNAYNVAANRASSNFDIRHSLSISYVYGLPFFRGSDNALARNVLGGWQVSGITVAQTGTPFNVVNGSGFGDNAGVANGTASSGSHPDLAGNPHSLSGNTNPLQFYNPAAYAIPTALTFGNVGRNTLNLPGRLNFNFGLFKRFNINERAGFEFRAETFNLFNHTEFNSINNSFGGSGFLQLNGTHDPRRMQLGLRFYF